MAKEISNQKFQTDVMRFIEIATQKFDGLISDVKTNSFKPHKLEAEVARGFGEHHKRFDIVDTGLEILREQNRMLDVKIGEVASKAMEIDKRLIVIESKLTLMETKWTSLEDEVRQIRFELDDLNEIRSLDAKTSKRLVDIEARVFQLEEKLTA